MTGGRFFGKYVERMIGHINDRSSKGDPRDPYDDTKAQSVGNFSRIFVIPRRRPRVPRCAAKITRALHRTGSIRIAYHLRH